MHSSSWQLPQILAHLLLVSVLSSFCRATLSRRDTHALVVPLTYSPESNLMTASVSIGSTRSTYNLILDTGSPFLVLQNTSFHPSTTSFDPSTQPDLGGAQGYMTTTPEPSSKAPVKPKIHFVVDTAFLNEASGERAGAGARAGNATIGLTTLDDLKGAQGILGLSPPFSMIKSGPEPRPPPKQTRAEGKKKKEEKRDSSGGKLPSLDVSFLHSYLSPNQRKVLGITGSSHFYIDLSPSTSLHPLPFGELVFPLSGTSLPTTTSGYNYSSAITITPESGSTYPAHPFWGIAHRPDLLFTLNNTPLANVRIDALLLDSGTSGIIAPPSEVAKIFATLPSIHSSTPAGTSAVLGRTACSADLQMGISVGGQQAKFQVVRRTVQKDGTFVQAKHDAESVDEWSKRSAYDGLVRWKSYVDSGVNAYLQGVGRFVRGLTGFWRLPPRKRHLKKRLLQIGVNLLTPDPPEPPTAQQAPAQDNANPHPPPAADDLDQCQISLMGSPQVEAMFPSNGPDFKVWILGIEFFQSNLVYHNLDTAQTVIVPRNDGSEIQLLG